jgi:hypothetical protein
MSAPPPTAPSAQPIDRGMPAAPCRSRERLWYHAVLLGLSLATLLAARMLSVRDAQHVALAGWERPLPELCSFRKIVGLDCPGCGLTRCFVSAAHGRLADAWRFHPAGVLLFGLIAAQLPFRGWQLWRILGGRAEWTHAWLCGLLWLLLAALVAQWLWRSAAALG